MQPTYLVACVSQKLDRRAPAAELYRSDWFRKALAYVEGTGARWFILSAAHGLVSPDQRLDPYDVTLRGLRRPSAVGGPDRVGLTTAAARPMPGLREGVPG